MKNFIHALVIWSAMAISPLASTAEAFAPVLGEIKESGKFTGDCRDRVQGLKFACLNAEQKARLKMTNFCADGEYAILPYWYTQNTDQNEVSIGSGANGCEFSCEGLLSFQCVPNSPKTP